MEVEELREVAGPGYAFDISTAFEVRRAGTTVRATADRADVSVTTFRLARPYRPALWPSVVRELDEVAQAFARKVGGRVEDARTRPLAGRRARDYRIAGARDGSRRLAFVLRARTEYQLLCRWRDEARATGEDACRALYETFRLR